MIQPYQAPTLHYQDVSIDYNQIELRSNHPEEILIAIEFTPEQLECLHQLIKTNCFKYGPGQLRLHFGGQVLVIPDMHFLGVDNRVYFTANTASPK